MNSTEEIRDSVRKAVHRVPHLHGNTFDVEVPDQTGNVVVLTGTVRFYYHAQLAQEAARRAIQRIDVKFILRNNISVEN